MAMSNEAPQGQAARAALGETRRLVVKIGSRSLMADGTKRYGYGPHKGQTSATSRKVKGPYERMASRTPPITPRHQ